MEGTGWESDHGLPLCQPDASPRAQLYFPFVSHAGSFSLVKVLAVWGFGLVGCRRIGVVGLLAQGERMNGSQWQPVNLPARFFFPVRSAGMRWGLVRAAGTGLLGAGGLCAASPGAAPQLFPKEGSNSPRTLSSQT